MHSSIVTSHLGTFWFLMFKLFVKGNHNVSDYVSTIIIILPSFGTCWCRSVKCIYLIIHINLSHAKTVSKYGVFKQSLYQYDFMSALTSIPMRKAIQRKVSGVRRDKIKLIGFGQGLYRFASLHSYQFSQLYFVQGYQIGAVKHVNGTLLWA